MIRHIYFSHYRTIREVTAAAITTGVAMLLGHLILLARV